MFEVLAEPNRRLILDLLRIEDRPVNDLVGVLSLSQPAVSKHLRVLRDAGLVVSRVEAQQRVYSLSPRPLQELDAWLAPYRESWGDALDRLEEQVTVRIARRRANDSEEQPG